MFSALDAPVTPRVLPSPPCVGITARHSALTHEDGGLSLLLLLLLSLSLSLSLFTLFHAGRADARRLREHQAKTAVRIDVAPSCVDRSVATLAHRCGVLEGNRRHSQLEQAAALYTIRFDIPHQNMIRSR